MRCGPGFTAKRRTVPKRSPRIIPMLATFGSGLRSMPIQNWFPLGCSGNETPELLKPLLTTLLPALATESRSLPQTTLSFKVAHYPGGCTLLLQRENVVLTATRLCHPLSFKQGRLGFQL